MATIARLRKFWPTKAVGENMKRENMKIELVNPKRLIPSAYNPRKMAPAEMEKLRRSIREFGLVEPIVVQMPGNRIVGGHQRAEAAIAEGLTQVPIVRLRISDARAKALNLALNKISGEWDQDKLRALLEELKLDADNLDLTGFDEDEIEKLLADALDATTIERMELKPAPEIVWILAGIPLKRLPAMQKHIAALEAAAGITVQSSRPKSPEAQKR